MKTPRPTRAIAAWLRLFLASLLVLGIAASVLSCARAYWDEDGPLQTFGADAPARTLRATGHARAVDGRRPPLCFVMVQRYQSCGKSSCWRTISTDAFARGALDIADGRGGPRRVALSADFTFVPDSPSSAKLSVGATHDWGSGIRRYRYMAHHRVRERCVADGEQITVAGCLQGEGAATSLASCGHGAPYSVVFGPSAQPALDDAANLLMYRVAAISFCALGLAWLALPRRELLAAALAERAGVSVDISPVALVALGAVPVAALVWHLLARGGPPEVTWSWGRGGYVLTLASAAAWSMSALFARARSRQLFAATEPVRATRRSLLARADGTVELHVRAVPSATAGAPPIIPTDQDVLFAEARVSERIQQGRSSHVVERLVSRTSDSVTVRDESGTGTLDLRNAVLDLATYSASWRQEVPGLAPRGQTLSAQDGHQGFLVVEKMIRADEPLYVLGEVTGLSLSPSEAGYRTVTGSPTLGGTDAPLLVYAGTERGLLEALEREARSRRAHVLAAACALVVLGVAWLFLASR